MRILRGYCLKELITPFLLSLAMFTFIFLVGNLVKLADLLLNKGVNLIDIAKILILLIPQLVVFVLPTSALAAVLIVFGGLAQNNEITAMKANGINILRVMVPVIMAGFLLSLAALFFVDQVQPRLHQIYRQVFNELIIKRPEAYIEAGRFIKDFKGYIIRAQKVEGKRLEGVTIFQPQEGKPTRTIMAESGEIVSSDDRTLGLRLYNGVSDEPNPDDPSVLYKLHFNKFELPSLSLADGPKGRAKKKYKDMSLNELIYILRTMDDYKEQMELQGMDSEDLKRDVKSRTLEARTEIQRKISFSFATFSFVLIGLPLAVVTRRGEIVVSFALSMIVVAVYYILSIWAKTLAINVVLPPLVVLWLPNAIAIVIAFFLMTKVIRL